MGFLAVISLPPVRAILRGLQSRIESGSAVEIGPLEIGEDLHQLDTAGKQRDPEPLPGPEQEYGYAGISSGVRTEEQSDKSSPEAEWYEEWNRVYQKHRMLFLTHVIRPSVERGQKYDVFIYLVRHGGEGFEDVEFAEFFLGPDWGNQVFKRYEQKGQIGLSTAAYGTFLCVCWVQMKDGKRIFLNRFIDFEMSRAFK